MKPKQGYDVVAGNNPSVTAPVCTLCAKPLVRLSGSLACPVHSTRGVPEELRPHPRGRAVV